MQPLLKGKYPSGRSLEEQNSDNQQEASSSHFRAWGKSYKQRPAHHLSPYFKAINQVNNLLSSRKYVLSCCVGKKDTFVTISKAKFKFRILNPLEVDLRIWWSWLPSSFRNLPPPRVSWSLLALPLPGRDVTNQGHLHGHSSD